MAKWCYVTVWLSEKAWCKSLPPKSKSAELSFFKKKCLFLENKVLCGVNILTFKNHCLEMNYFGWSQSPRLYQVGKYMSLPNGQLVKSYLLIDQIKTGG